MQYCIRKWTQMDASNPGGNKLQGFPGPQGSDSMTIRINSG